MAKKPAYRAGRDQAATAENVELLTGQRGDRLDKAVTFRELAALGLSTLRPGAGGVYVPGKNPDLFPPGQMEFPHAPVNVIANGAFHTVLVEWDPPQYRGHAHAEIWRAESDNQAEATLVGTSSANLFSDAIGKGATFYYWVRFVNGKDDKGPFQGMQGVKAETSRDVQDILDELQGKIEESHLAQALLRPIEQVPQLQLDIAILKPKVDEIEVMRPKVNEIDLILHKVDEIEVILPKIDEIEVIRPKVAAIEVKIPAIDLDIAILKPKVDEIEVIRPKVAAIEVKIPSIEQELAGLDERQKVAQELLDDAQQQLGMSSIEIGLVQDRLNAKLDKYKGDFDSFRDAVFVVDPESGSITMDAVNAVREELHSSITGVQQELDAVSGQITSKADNVTVDSQGQRITEAEQRINGLDASLSQTVTRGEFTGEQQRVTQIGQELDATKGVLAQKATQQEVDEQGERLANAESKLTVHTDELSSQAQRLDGLAAQITQGDETLRASITELARVSAESDQVTTQRVSGLEVRAGASEAKIQALEEIFADDGGITAGRFDAITAELELQRGNDDDNASAAIDGALAVDERDRETRKAFGAIRTEQRVILTEQQAQAQRTADMEVKFEAKDAATQARISSVEKVTSDADSALAQRIDNVTTEFKAADAQVNADILSLARSSAAADEALSLRQDQLAATLSSAAAELAANITQEESARVTADEAISMRVAEVEAQFSGGLDEVNARVAAEESARANQDEALAQQIRTVDAAFKAADTALSASLSESSKALADSDRALGERISTLDVTVGENSASITELQQAVVSNEASLSQRQDKMESEIVVGAVSQVEGTLALDERDRENRKARGAILQQQSTLANQQEAQARTIEQLTAEFDSENGEIRAQITNEQLTRATADEALSQRISVVDSEFKAADAATNAAVAAEVRARSDADSALAEQLSTLDTEFKGAEQALAASIDEVSRVSAEANQSLSEQLSQVKATAESAGTAAAGAQSSANQAKEDAAAAAGIANGKGKVLIQSAAPAVADRLAQNLWIDTTSGTNTPKRWSGSAWVAVTDKVAIDAAQAAAAAQASADQVAQGVAKNTAAINDEVKARADADSAMAQRIDSVTAEFQAADTQANADIRALEQSSASADEALSLRQDELAAALSDATTDIAANITREESARVTADEAISRRVSEVEAQFGSDLDEVNARVAAEESARANQDEALAQQISTVDAAFKAADTALSASLAESSKAMADADRALGERISTLDVTVGENSASITELQQAVVSNEASLSQRQDKMESEIGIGAISQVEGALTGDERDRENRKARGAILQQQSTLANQQEAQARTVEQLTAEFDAETADLKAQITNEQLVRSTADEALAQKTSVLEAQIEGVDQSLSASIAEVARVSADADAVMTEKLNQQQSTMQTADAELSSRINEEATTRADAVESLASQIQQVTANYQQGDQQLQGKITAESVARADAMQALGSQIDTVSAVAGSKNKTFFQATAPGSAMGTGDLWFDTANNNRPYRYSGTAWVATDDPRIAANAAAVQLQSQAIADLQNGAQAMWTAKASAGQITAGIGLIAKSDGTSQVMVSASQFFVFNPNSPSTTAPLFAIDNGQAVIAEAIIRKATIQILNAEKITADYIKAGASITTPLINGGQIDMGNAFLSGGAAGFGKGGPYGGWGWGWYTIIYADGSIYTNRLYAEGGYVKNMNIGNCTISGDCDVKGTVYAAKLVGDVTKVRAFELGLLTGQIIPGGTAITLLSVNFDSADFNQELTIEEIAIRVWAYEQGATTARMYVKVGSAAAVLIDERSSPADIFTAIASRTVSIPAGQSSLTIYYVAERKTSYRRDAQRRMIYLNKQGGTFSAS
ncbi:phage tail tip fiber protein [Aeromonas caviae]|uniref:phage tail tip fiber protein n=1 Tax=Aeromonas caviae TaxID=648 RepID=UPI0038D14B1D